MCNEGEARDLRGGYVRRVSCCNEVDKWSGIPRVRSRRCRILEGDLPFRKLCGEEVEEVTKDDQGAWCARNTWNENGCQDGRGRCQRK